MQRWRRRYRHRRLSSVGIAIERRQLTLSRRRRHSLRHDNVLTGISAVRVFKTPFLSLFERLPAVEFVYSYDP